MTRISTHLRANIVGYVALFFALCTGAYAAGLAPDSVRSRHIKDGQVMSADIADGSVVGSDVTDQGLTGFDVATDSLQGQDIQESSLGEVPKATIAGHGGYGRQSEDAAEFGSKCNPENDFITCSSVGLTPSAPGRVLVIGRYSAYGDDRALCRLGSSSGGAIPGTPTIARAGDPGIAVGITEVYQPGSYSFGLDCREPGGETLVEGARVTAVVISPY